MSGVGKRMQITDIITQIVIFFAMYVQVFLLVTFLERRKVVFNKTPTTTENGDFPTVTIIVPCWNESKTVAGTVESLLHIDYPKDKLSIFLVDDGSTDQTLSIMKTFEVHPQVRVFTKENGGKHSAVNLGIQNATSEFVGCLDADSYADKQALKKIIACFKKDEKLMSVSPSVVIHNPKNIVEIAQRADYQMAAFIKNMYASVNGMHVAAGAFTIFRKKVFDTIGLYRKAYNTEDFEITLRMYMHQYKVGQCPDAYVYTVPPRTIKTLFKQRLRWMYGFIKNMIDYRSILFKREYGNVAIFTLPSCVISACAVIYILFSFVFATVNDILTRITNYYDTGIIFRWSAFRFDWFFINLRTTFIMTILLYILVVSFILIGKKISGHKPRLSLDMLYFIAIYSVVAPFWLLKAVYNVVFSLKTEWR